MSIVSLRTVGFRNLADRELRTDGRELFLVGENGQGKTNLLEALYFCSYASSFRSARDADLVRSGEKDCSVSVRLDDAVYNELTVKLEGGKKSIRVDGKRVDDRKELLEINPTIVFCHEDMEFVSGPPERRRWFFDQSLSLYDVSYLDDLRRYRRVLKIRNTLLKEHRSQTLDVIDGQLVVHGLELMKKRAAAAKLFSETFGPLYQEVSGVEGIAVRYSPSWKTNDQDEIVSSLAERREMDSSFGTSLSGPHRDRYSFTRKDVDFSSKASTGQRRLLALLLRVAQARRFSAMTGRKSILLLDDVLLELDPEKRRRFFTALPDYEQAFFTFLPEEPFERYKGFETRIYTVRDGMVEL